MNTARKDANVTVVGLILLISAVITTALAIQSVPINAVLAFILKSVLLGMAVGYIARESDKVEEGTKVTLGFVIGYGCVFLGGSTIIVAGLLIPMTLSIFLLGFTFLYSGAPHRVMDPGDFIGVFGIVAVVVFIVGIALNPIIFWFTNAAIPLAIANPFLAGGIIVVIAILILCVLGEIAQQVE